MSGRNSKRGMKSKYLAFTFFCDSHSLNGKLRSEDLDCCIAISSAIDIKEKKDVFI